MDDSDITMNTDESVYELITKLCINFVESDVSKDVSVDTLIKQMRAKCFEIILNKNGSERTEIFNPISDIIGHYYVCKTNISNVIDYEACNELKKCIDVLIDQQNDQKPEISTNVLKFLVSLKNSETKNVSDVLYKRPFTMGELDGFLPRQYQTGSVQPYTYFPEKMFHLPFRMPSKNDDMFSFRNALLKSSKDNFFEIPTNSKSATSLSVNVQSAFNIPRLLEPRDISFSGGGLANGNIVATLSSDGSSEIKSEIAKESDESINIWDIANHLGSKIPEQIWDIAAQQNTAEEGRALIAMSRNQIKLWRKRHNPRLLSIISEDQLIRHISYLCIGIESTSFTVDRQNNIFKIRPGLSLQGISNEYLYGYLENFLLVGTCYMRLYKFAFEFPINEKFESGFIFEAARNALRDFILKFRQKATKLVENCVWNPGTRCLPTLLNLLHWIEPLKDQIMTVASIYRVIDIEGEACLPKSAAIMSYLYKEISMVTQPDTAQVMFAALHQICNIYFKFIEKLIFEGELEDPHNEFFIRRSSDYIHSKSRRYWERGLQLNNNSVPEFIAPLAKLVLLCGKSLRLLKLCNQHDPLIILLSGDHPSIKCCTSFREVDEQKKILDLYRTRCLFVSGEPVTFDQILLKADAAKKACREMATIKQAETMEKIVAERKRLAALIQAEKQHSLKILEAAIAKNQAMKDKGRSLGQKEELNASGDQTDSKDSERDKIAKYYSKLNEEVEKRKKHAEWKMKRLQLDESRMQLLSSEERKYKHEKLEKEHGSLELSTIIECAEATDSITDYKNNNDSNQTLLSIDSIYSETGTLNKKIQTFDSEGNIITTVDSRSFIDLIDTKSFDNVTLLQDTLNSNTLVVNTAFIESEIRNVTTQFKDLKSEAAEAKKKILNSEIGLETMGKQDVSPISEAQIAAVRIKNKMTDSDITNSNILDNTDEDNQENTYHSKQEPKKLCNIAQKEAAKNRSKSVNSNISEDNLQTYNSDFDTSDGRPAARKPLNIAQEEAIVNRNRNSTSEITEDIVNSDKDLDIEVKPKNKAQEEAVMNRNKSRNSDISKPNKKYLSTGGRTPSTQAQEEAVINRNKGQNSDISEENVEYTNREFKKPLNVAQTEASLNKNKSRYSDISEEKNFESNSNEFVRKPLNIAQEEAVRNKSRVMNSEYGIGAANVGSPRRAALKLNLNAAPLKESLHSFSTPAGFTPSAEYFRQLGQDTPITAEPRLPNINLEYPTKESKSNQRERDNGFQFPNPPILEDDFEQVKQEENVSDEDDFQPIWDVETSYNPSKFDPFNVKDIDMTTKCYFTKKLNEYDSNVYSDVKMLLEEAAKKPYTDIFEPNRIIKEESGDFQDVSIATLRACLQRSILLPLTYQLEVVNSSILTYFLVNLDLYGHLQSLKDYFFLMDGEFCSTICHNLFSKLNSVINPEELLNFTTLHGILDKAIVSSVSSSNKYAENLSFTLSEPLWPSQEWLGDALQGLALSYSVTWPLDIVLAPDTMKRYADVFHFLLKMRRVAWTLGNDFEALKISAKLNRDRNRKLIASPQYHAIQIYRHVMAALMRALDNYIVTTCIQVSWKELVQILRDARTLDDLYNLHVLYVKKVMFRCLLNKRSAPLMKVLDDIFNVVMRFSRILNSRDWELDDSGRFYTTPSFAQLQDLYALCTRLTRHLHRLVCKLLECGYQPHLNELLSLINLNEYYHPLPH